MNSRFDQLTPGVQSKIHFFFDILCIASGLFFTLPLHGRLWFWNYLMVMLAASSAWSLSAAVMRLYSPATPRRLTDSLTLRGLGSVAMSAAIFLTPQANAIAHRSEDLLRFMLFFFFSSAAARLWFFKPLAKFNGPVQDVLIVGTGHLAKKTYTHLTHSANEQKSRVIGFLRLPHQAQVVNASEPILGNAEDLLHILSNYPVSEVYFSAKVIDHGAILQKLVKACEDVGMPFALPVHSLDFERAKLQSSSPANDGYLHYMSTAYKPLQYALKRLIDIVASSLALLVLSPLFLLVALAIKTTSRGPIFFVQKRVGLHGATFNLLKFRSMVVDAEKLQQKLMDQNQQTGPVFKMAKDPRITSIGRFIRKYSIDELPQLINILRGDMTIVGPRPALPKEVLAYTSWQRRRLSVRPGLTCFWQVSGRNGILFDEWMRLDLRYVDEFDLMLDFRLILQTVPAVLAGRGAS